MYPLSEGIPLTQAPKPGTRLAAAEELLEEPLQVPDPGGLTGPQFQADD
jgi:hypothetical protein